MADFFKGLAGGFGTGLQFGQAVRERNMRDELAQAYAKPETSQGFTAEQGQQLEAMASAINPETGRPYYRVQAGEGGNYTVTPDFTEAQTPRTGMDTGSQYGVANVELQPTGLGRAGVVAQPIPFNQQQVQDYGGRRVAGQFDPSELRGLQMQEAARILGSYGDVRGAAALESQADELRRGLTRDKREEAAEADRVARRPLEIQQLENALVSQGLTIDQAKRAAEEQVNTTAARERLQQRRKDGPLTAAIISDVAGEFNLDPTKFLQAEDAVNTLEIKDLKRNLSSAALKGEDGLNKFLADKFDPDKTDNIKPMITKAKDGSFVVTYGDRVLQEYGSHKNMMSLVGGVINMIDQNPFATLTTLSTLETQAASRRASDASVAASYSLADLRKDQRKALATSGENREKIAGLIEDFEALTDAEKAGVKGQNINTQINQLNLKAGGQLVRGPAPKAERPALSEADATARAKAMVEAKELGPTGKRLTFSEALDVVRGTPPRPGTPAAAKAQLDTLLGGGGDPFAAPPAAAQPTTGLQTRTAPARNAPAEPNPYVDARGRPLPVAPAGAPSIASTAIPAAASAVESAVGTQAAATRYLQAKIARNEPLTATDRARAVQLGLIR